MHLQLMLQQRCECVHNIHSFLKTNFNCAVSVTSEKIIPDSVKQHVYFYLLFSSWKDFCNNMILTTALYLHPDYIFLH